MEASLSLLKTTFPNINEDIYSYCESNLNKYQSWTLNGDVDAN